MVSALLGPIALQVLNAEVEAPYLRLSVIDDVHCPWSEAYRGQPRWRAQTLLRGAVAHVHIPVVHPYVMAPKGGDRVNDDHGFVAVDQVDDIL